MFGEGQFNISLPDLSLPKKFHYFKENFKSLQSFLLRNSYHTALAKKKLSSSSFPFFIVIVIAQFIELAMKCWPWKLVLLLPSFGAFHIFNNGQQFLFSFFGDMRTDTTCHQTCQLLSRVFLRKKKKSLWNHHKKGRTIYWDD